MKLSVFKDSVIDDDVIEDFEKETKQVWTDKHELMARICSFFGYGFAWNANAEIVINNGFYTKDEEEDDYKFTGRNDRKHREYKSVDDMVVDWKRKVIKANKAATDNNAVIPFLREWVSLI